MWKFGRSAVALMVAAAMMLGGCSAAQKDSGAQTADSGSTEGTVQMGRYVEDYVEGNVEMNRSTSLTRLEDGRLAFFSYNYGPYVSTDDGRTWEPWQAEWFQDNCIYRSFRCAAIAPDGTMFVGYMDYSAEVDLEADADADEGAATDAETAAEDETATEDETVTEDETAAEDEAEEEGGSLAILMEYQLVQPDGSFEKLEFAGMGGEWITDCWFAPDNRLYVSDTKQLYEMSMEGEVTKVFETPSHVQQLLFLTDDRMLAATEQGVLFYDRKNRVQLDRDAVLDEFLMAQVKQNGNMIKYTSDAYSVYMQAGEADTLYLVSGDGIYSHILGGGTVEKLLEGSLCTLGDPSKSIYGMQLLSDNRFLVLYGQGTGTFAWREDVPTLPEKELSVYSLERDKMVQQAVSLFQTEHQDVYVNYEVGLEENSGQTKEDAIKALNTEILAGHGPDVIILDGFPLDSWLEKGMLSDLSAVLARAEETEPVLHNIAVSLERDGKLMAIPMRYRFPGIIGPAQELAGAKDLKGLADATEALRRKKESGSVTGSIDAQSTLRILETACSPAWEAEGGGLNRNAVEEFLTEAKRIFAAEDAGTTPEEKVEWEETKNARYGRMNGMETDDTWMLMDISSGNIFLQEDRIGMGYINEVWSLEIMFSVRRQKEGLLCDLLMGQSDKVFIPYTIAGIPVSAKEPELAEQFVERMLSADAAVGGGFSINRDAVEKEIRLNGDGNGGIIGAMMMTDGNSYQQMTVYQMTQEEVDWLYETLESLQTPSLRNEILISAVLENGEKFLKDEIDLETALTEIENRVKLSMVE